MNDSCRRRFLEGTNLNIDAKPLMLKEWFSKMSLFDINFKTTPYLTRVIGLLLFHMSEENSKLISGIFPKLLMVDNTLYQPIRWKNYLPMIVL